MFAGTNWVLSPLLAYGLLLQGVVDRMIVKCAICGFEGHAVVWEHWYRTPGSMPELWICDEHRGDFIANQS